MSKFVYVDVEVTPGSKAKSKEFESLMSGFELHKSSDSIGPSKQRFKGVNRGTDIEEVASIIGAAIKAFNDYHELDNRWSVTAAD